MNLYRMATQHENYDYVLEPIYLDFGTILEPKFGPDGVILSPMHPWEPALIKRARLFACELHKTQTRRYTEAPYIVHPYRVSELVRCVPHTEEALAAAWLLDSVNLCQISVDELEKRVSPDVRRMVGRLTKQEYRPTNVWLSGACHDTQTVKLAAIYDNVSTITARDPKFCAQYLPKKREQLRFLKAGDDVLWRGVDKLLKIAGY